MIISINSNHHLVRGDKMTSMNLSISKKIELDAVVVGAGFSGLYMY